MALTRHRFETDGTVPHTHSSHTLVLGAIVKISRQKMVTSLYNSQASKQVTFHLNDGIAAIPTPAMVAIMPLYYNVQRSLAWRPLGAPTDPYDRCAYWSTRVRLFRYLCVSTN